MTTFPTRISHAQALQILVEVGAARRMPAESLALARADGRILRRDVVAPIALPPFDNSAMDGFALRSADLSAADGWLPLAGDQYAGADTAVMLPPGSCMRITTGAALPQGADAVVPRENVALERDGVRFPQPAPPGQFVRPRGGDVQAGTRVLEAGGVMTPARMGLAAALGVAQLEVSARPTVAVITSGDELVEPGLPLAAGQIYNSNRDLAMALLRGDGLTPTAWPTLPDDPARIRRMLEDAAGAFDLLISCGGVSAGEKDHLPALLAELGEVHFWKVQMRPGMPLVFGTVGRCLVLGLPGNPVSVLATYLMFGRPLLDALQGLQVARPQWHARLSSAWEKRHDRREFLRGQLSCDASGQLSVTPNAADASYQLRGAADSDTLIELPEGAQRFEAGALVRIHRY